MVASGKGLQRIPRRAAGPRSRSGRPGAGAPRARMPPKEYLHGLGLRGLFTKLYWGRVLSGVSPGRGVSPVVYAARHNPGIVIRK